MYNLIMNVNLNWAIKILEDWSVGRMRNDIDEFSNDDNHYEDNYNDASNLDLSYSNEDNYTYADRTHYNKESIEKNDGRVKGVQTIDKGLKNFLITSVVIIIVLLALLVGYFIYAITGNNSEFKIELPWSTSNNINNYNNDENENRGIVNGPSINIEEQPQDGSLSAEQVYDKSAPSVVGVVVYDYNAGIISDPTSQGSGIVISQDGYIVTNSHVVGDSKEANIKIVTSDAKEYSGKVIGYDTRTDLAVIKADVTGLNPASFADSDTVKVGSWALAIGNPGGLNFASSLTRGTISAVNRSVGSSQSLVKYIQTDAAINPGNSGGALLNMYGQVIGVNSIKIALADYEGMGFAIPSNTVKSVVDDIISKGYVSGRVRLGITGKAVSNYQAQIYNVPIGIIVSEISSDSDLRSKGVQVGDIITKINDVNITGFEVFYSELTKYKAGDSVKLTVFRQSTNRLNSSTFDVTVKLLEDKGETQQTSYTSKRR